MAAGRLELLSAQSFIHLATSSAEARQGASFLSASSAGAITKTPPSSSGHFVTRVGEAATTTSLVVKTEPPIEIS